MILSSADNVKAGNTQVSSVRLGSVQIWPAENAVFIHRYKRDWEQWEPVRQVVNFQLFKFRSIDLQ